MEGGAQVGVGLLVLLIEPNEVAGEAVHLGDHVGDGAGCRAVARPALAS